MKKLEVVIAPFKLNELCNALEKYGAKDIIFSEVIDLKKEKNEIFRGARAELAFLKKVKIEFHINDDKIGKCVKSIDKIALLD